MAKYDQGGGCACGLKRICDCGSGQADGTRVSVPKVERSVIEIIEDWRTETINVHPDCLLSLPLRDVKEVIKYFDDTNDFKKDIFVDFLRKMQYNISIS